MGAIYHDSGLPSFIAPGPKFSFFDVTEIHQAAPESYEEARVRLQAWECRFGAVWYRHNANLAHQFWQLRRPWWL